MFLAESLAVPATTLRYLSAECWKHASRRLFGPPPEFRTGVPPGTYLFGPTIPMGHWAAIVLKLPGEEPTLPRFCALTLVLPKFVQRILRVSSGNNCRCAFWLLELPTESRKNLAFMKEYPIQTPHFELIENLSHYRCCPDRRQPRITDVLRGRLRRLQPLTFLSQDGDTVNTDNIHQRNLVKNSRYPRAGAQRTRDSI